MTTAPVVVHEFHKVREGGYGFVIRLCTCGHTFPNDETAEAHVAAATPAPPR